MDQVFGYPYVQEDDGSNILNGSSIPRMHLGDQVALIAPSGPIPLGDPSVAIENIKTLGFAPILGAHLSGKDGYLAGTDDQRLSDLNWALEDPRIKGIIFARGGYGSARLLNRVNYQAFSDSPKPIIGYSDITALHCAFATRTGIPTFHGPVGFSDLTPFSLESMRSALTGVWDRDTFSPLGETTQTEWLRQPKNDISGPMFGGNLCMLSSLVGTPFFPDISGGILFIEEIGEQPYRVDRFLTHLTLAGILEKVQVVIVGQFTHCEYPEAESAGLPSSLDVVTRCLTPLNIPVLLNADIGHVPNQITLPIGARATLSCGPSPTLVVHNSHRD